jgi:hypothetical protein
MALPITNEPASELVNNQRWIEFAMRDDKISLLTFDRIKTRRVTRTNVGMEWSKPDNRTA